MATCLREVATWDSWCIVPPALKFGASGAAPGEADPGYHYKGGAPGLARHRWGAFPGGYRGGRQPPPGKVQGSRFKVQSSRFMKGTYRTMIKSPPFFRRYR